MIVFEINEINVFMYRLKAYEQEFIELLVGGPTSYSSKITEKSYRMIDELLKEFSRFIQARFDEYGEAKLITAFLDKMGERYLHLFDNIDLDD